jgi:nucleotide-binding universal stress UspA family protein
MEALDWSLDSLVQHGDELVVLRGLDSDDVKSRGANAHEDIREDARKLMRVIQAKNVEYDPDRLVQSLFPFRVYISTHSLQLSIVVEFVAGRLLETIERMIALYRPDALVVGTRGQKGMSTWASAFTGGVGSVSRYPISLSPQIVSNIFVARHCLSRSPVPVIVVRPERKVRKTVEKRRADPKRRTHFDE